MLRRIYPWRSGKTEKSAFDQWRKRLVFTAQEVKEMNISFEKKHVDPSVGNEQNLTLFVLQPNITVVPLKPKFSSPHPIFAIRSLNSL